MLNHSNVQSTFCSQVYLKGELFSARKDAEMDSHNSKIVSAVERTIKKHADNILRVLEGMNGRLSHLESVTQVLERSVASLKASVDDYHGEADAKSKALNNHVVEVFLYLFFGVCILVCMQSCVHVHKHMSGKNLGVVPFYFSVFVKILSV